MNLLEGMVLIGGGYVVVLGVAGIMVSRARREVETIRDERKMARWDEHLEALASRNGEDDDL